MKFRIYGNVKDTKTAQYITGAGIKLYLNEEEIQKGESVKNGFYEIIAEIDDSRIESGQQLKITFSKEGYKMQEQRLLATEGAFNLDVTLDAEVKEPSSFNWRPVIIGGIVLVVLLIVGAIAMVLLTRTKSPEILSFSTDLSAIELGKSATLSWQTKNASSVTIEPDIEAKDLNGETGVQPLETTEYILTASNEKKKVTKVLTVEVKDRTLPTVTITHKPLKPTKKDTITFTARASDKGGISKVEILVNDKKIDFTNRTTCTFTGGPYSIGRVKYSARAYDRAGNQGKSRSGTIAVADVPKPTHTIIGNPLFNSYLKQSFKPFTSATNQKKVILDRKAIVPSPDRIIQVK